MGYLVPTKQWVYALHKVVYYDTKGGRAVLTRYIASASDNHLEADVWRDIHGAEWAEWELVANNVGHPRIVGRLHNMDLHEDGAEHGHRLARERGLVQ